MAISTGDGRLIRWDLTTGDRRGAPVMAHAGPALTAHFDPAGDRLVTTGTDGTAVLWDPTTGQRVGEPIRLNPNVWAYALFVDDGKSLVTFNQFDRPRTWDVDQSSWLERACRTVDRSITRSEWRALLPDRPYRPSCRP